MTSFLKYFLCLTFLITTLTSCGGDENQEELVTVEIPAPITFLIDRTFFITANLSITLRAPWAIVNFNAINNTDRIITIIGGAYVVTDPITGNRRLLSLTATANINLNYTGVIFPSRDVNCDGLVDETEATNNVGPAQPCTAITTATTIPDPDDPNATVNVVDEIPVVLLNERILYLSGMGDAGVPGSTDIENSISQIYRGLTFPVEARIEGWVGSPTLPESNFFQNFFFTTIAN